MSHRIRDGALWRLGTLTFVAGLLLAATGCGSEQVVVQGKDEAVTAPVGSEEHLFTDGLLLRAQPQETNDSECPVQVDVIARNVNDSGTVQVPTVWVLVRKDDRTFQDKSSGNVQQLLKSALESDMETEGKYCFDREASGGDVILEMRDSERGDVVLPGSE